MKKTIYKCAILASALYAPSILAAAPTTAQVAHNANGAQGGLYDDKIVSILENNGVVCGSNVLGDDDFAKFTSDVQCCINKKWISKCDREDVGLYEKKNFKDLSSVKVGGQVYGQLIGQNYAEKHLVFLVGSMLKPFFLHTQWDRGFVLKVIESSMQEKGFDFSKLSELFKCADLCKYPMDVSYRDKFRNKTFIREYISDVLIKLHYLCEFQVVDVNGVYQWRNAVSSLVDPYITLFAHRVFHVMEELKKVDNASLSVGSAVKLCAEASILLLGDLSKLYEGKDTLNEVVYQFFCQVWEKRIALYKDLTGRELVRDNLISLMFEKSDKDDSVLYRVLSLDCYGPSSFRNKANNVKWMETVISSSTDGLGYNMVLDFLCLSALLQKDGQLDGLFIDDLKGQYDALGGRFFSAGVKETINSAFKCVRELCKDQRQEDGGISVDKNDLDRIIDINGVIFDHADLLENTYTAKILGESLAVVLNELLEQDSRTSEYKAKDTTLDLLKQESVRLSTLRDVVSKLIAKCENAMGQAHVAPESGTKTSSPQTSGKAKIIDILSRDVLSKLQALQRAITQQIAAASVAQTPTLDDQFASKIAEVNDEITALQTEKTQIDQNQNGAGNDHTKSTMSSQSVLDNATDLENELGEVKVDSNLIAETQLQATTPPASSTPNTQSGWSTAKKVIFWLLLGLSIASFGVGLVFISKMMIMLSAFSFGGVGALGTVLIGTLW